MGQEELPEALMATLRDNRLTFAQRRQALIAHGCTEKEADLHLLDHLLRAEWTTLFPQWAYSSGVRQEVEHLAGVAADEGTGDQCWRMLRIVQNIVEEGHASWYYDMHVLFRRWHHDSLRLGVKAAQEVPERLREYLKGQPSDEMRTLCHVCLALAGVAPLSDEWALQRLVSVFLHDWTEEPLWDELQSTSPDDTWRCACLAQAKQFDSVHRWDRIAPFLRDLSDKELLACVRSQIRNRAEITALLVSRGTGMLPHLREVWEQAETQRQSLIFAYVQLLTEAEESIPASWDTEIRELLEGWGNEEIELLPQLLCQLPRERAKHLLLATFQEGRVAQSVFGCLLDDDLFQMALAYCEERRWGFDHIADGVAKGGEGALPFLEQEIARKPPAALMELWVKALDKIDTPKSTELLASALGHSSKRVRESVIKSLAARTTLDPSALASQLRSRRKVARLGAAEILRQRPPETERDALILMLLEETQDSELKQALRNIPLLTGASTPQARWEGLLQSITDEEYTTLFDLWEHWLEKGRDNTREALLAKGEKAIAILHRLAEDWPYYQFSERFEQAIVLFAHEPISAWAAIDTISRQRWLSTRNEKLYRRVLMEHLKDDLIEPIRAYAPGNEHRVFFYSLLVKLSLEEGLDALIEMTGDPSQKVQEIAIKALIQLGDKALERLLVLLKSRKKSERLIASQLLMQLGLSEAYPSLLEAHQKERLPDVKRALAKALDRCDPDRTLDLETASEQAIIESLCAASHWEVPDFLTLSSLPPQRFKSGRALPEDAMIGLLSLLSSESPYQANTDARRLRKRLARKPLQQLGVAIQKEWEKAGAPLRARWALDQLAITATGSQLTKLGRDLPLTLHRSVDHAKIIVGVLARHGANVARSWLWTIYKHTRLKGQRRAAVMEGLRFVARSLNIDPDEDNWQQELQSHLIPSLHLELSEQHMGDIFLGLDGTRLEERYGYQFTLQVYPTECPSLGDLTATLALAVLDPKETREADPQKKSQATREILLALQERNATLQERTAECRRYLQETIAEKRQWTPPGWRSLFSHKILFRVLTTHTLFVTSEGVVFHQDDDGRMLDLDGEPVPCEDDTLIGWADVDDLDPSQRQAWAELIPQRIAKQLALWQRCEEEGTLEEEEDAVSELRMLLFQPPETKHWEALCTLLDTWSDSSTLEVALAYAQEHLQEWQDAGICKAPHHWSAQLLHTEHKERAKLMRKGHIFSEQHKGLMRLCTQLSFIRCDLKEQDALSMLSSPHLENIKSFHISSGRLYAAAARKLCREEDFLPALRTANFRNLVFYKQGWELLLSAPWLQRAQHLCLSNNTIDHQALQLLAENREHPLLTLQLDGVSLAKESVRLLCEHEAFAQLEELTLNWTRLNNEDVAQLVESSNFYKLKRLKLSDNMITEEGMELLSLADNFPALEHITVDHNSCYNIAEDIILREGGHLPQAALNSL